MMKDFFVKIESDSFRERFDTAKYISDYCGFIIRLVFLTAAMSVVNNIEADNWSVAFPKYTIKLFVFVLWLTLFVHVISVTQWLVYYILDSILPVALFDRWKPLKISLAIVSALVSVALMTGFQLGLAMLIKELVKAAQ